MPLSEKAKRNQIKYINRYAKDNYKRVPLNLDKDYYSQMRAFLDARGLKVNSYIKSALSKQLTADGFVYKEPDPVPPTDGKIDS